MTSRLQCIACGAAYPLFEIRYACDACGDLLEVAHDRDGQKAARDGAAWRALFDERLGAIAGPHKSGVWRYHELILPDLAPDDLVSLPEGNTNLYRVPRLEAASGSASIQVKHEGENPTLSFKDRGMTAGVSFAKRIGARVVACASTGDTSASMAVYAARVPGMRGVVVLPRQQVTLEQLSQPIAAGALTVSLPTDFDGCLRILREVRARRPLYLLNSVNPLRIEGQKAIAYEIAQQCGWDVPDWVVVPVGNAGNISAIGRGFDDLAALGVTSRRPRLLGAQAEAASPLARAEREGFRARVRVTAGPTAATAIKIGDPVSYDKAVRAVRGSGGHFVAVTEQEIHDAKAIVDADGVFICPNSATAVAGFLKARAAGTIAAAERVVIVATAHGCKFSGATIGYHGGALPGITPARANRVVEIEAEPRALERLLEAGVENPR
jgi:threonine synthase